ncbi:MAG: MepB family protein [Opitutaceae bacterium]|nr:MepB family protein [Cytophagales bacterium]
MLPKLLQTIKDSIYDKYNLVLTDFNINEESKEYEACSFKLNNKIVQYRTSKITPTKTGQFVSIWKRNKEGITAPFHISDELDFIIITSKDGENLGQFLFPKSVLVEKEIISTNTKEGKRGIRVYPPWDVVTNNQAKKTQAWQIKYFIDLKDDLDKKIALLTQLFKD